MGGRTLGLTLAIAAFALPFFPLPAATDWKSSNGIKAMRSNEKIFIENCKGGDRAEGVVRGAFTQRKQMCLSDE